MCAFLFIESNWIIISANDYSHNTSSATKTHHQFQQVSISFCFSFWMHLFVWFAHKSYQKKWSIELNNSSCDVFKQMDVCSSMRKKSLKNTNDINEKCSFTHSQQHLEWDAEWTGPQVIVEVSEKATNANGTNIEGITNCYFSFRQCKFFTAETIATGKVLYSHWLYSHWYHPFSWTKNYSTHRRSVDCCSCVAVMGRCNRLIFQSMGENPNVRKLVVRFFIKIQNKTDIESLEKVKIWCWYYGTGKPPYEYN